MLKLNRIQIQSLIIAVSLGIGLVLGYFINGAGETEDSDLALNPTKISDSALTQTVRTMEDMKIVDKAAVEIDGFNIEMNLAVHDSVNQIQAEQMGKQMANLLETKVIDEGHNGKELGKLYDDYNLYVQVEKNNHLLAEGTKSNVADEIMW